MPELYSELVKDPIPLDSGSVSGWKNIPIRQSDEPLVPLGRFSEYPDIATDAIYFGERSSSPYPTASVEGGLITHFVRESVANSLLKAQSLLPEGKVLVTFDAYRTLAVQQSLYEAYYNGLRQEHPQWSHEELSTETQKYVSLPSSDPDRPSPHNTGGSVDVAIISVPPNLADKLGDGANALSLDEYDQICQQATMLQFGTCFDHGGPEAALTYYERLAATRHLTKDEQEALFNRRLLFRVMTESGLQPYGDEWWHFNAPESQMGARTSGREVATFGAAQLTDDHLHHEYLRIQNHVNQLLSYLEGNRPTNPLTTAIGRAAILVPPRRSH